MTVEYGPNLVAELLSTLPAVEAAMNAHYRECSSLPHVIFADVFIHRYLEPMLERPEVHERELAEAFDFIERLAQDGDERVRELVADSVLEAFGNTAESRQELLSRSLPFMGPHTVSILSRIDD